MITFSTFLQTVSSIMANSNNTPQTAWTAAKSPWGKTASETEPSSDSVKLVNDVSLDDVMSEQLASHLQAEESVVPTIWEASAQGADIDEESKQLAEALALELASGEPPDTISDEYLAKMLQLEFDREHNAVLSREETRYNGKSKVSLNFDKFRRVDMSAMSDSDEEPEVDESTRDWDTFEEAQKNGSGVTIGKAGLAMQGNKVIATKHDSAVCGKRNACRVMDLPADVSTGDGGGFDMKLSNNVFNSLKAHSVTSSKRRARLHEKKEKSTVESVMDETSRMLIFKLLNGGQLDEVNGAISTGKEANVYHGIGGDPENGITMGEVAIKIYKTTLSEFKNRDPYIKG